MWGLGRVAGIGAVSYAGEVQACEFACPPTDCIMRSSALFFLAFWDRGPVGVTLFLAAFFSFAVVRRGWEVLPDVRDLRDLAAFFTCLGIEVRFAGLGGTVVAAADDGSYPRDGDAPGAEGSDTPLSEPPL